MSDKSTGLIERLEAETGQRIDVNDGNNRAMDGLFGAMSRLMGLSPEVYRERDDVVAGGVIRHQMTPEYRQEQAGRAMMADMLRAGMLPDDVKKLTG